MLESGEDRGGAHYSDDSIRPNNFPEILPQLLRVQVGRDASAGKTVVDYDIEWLKRRRLCVLGLGVDDLATVVHPSPGVFDEDLVWNGQAEETSRRVINCRVDLNDSG